MDVRKLFIESVSKLGLSKDKYNKVVTCFESSLSTSNDDKIEAERCLHDITRYINDIKQDFPYKNVLPGITQHIWTCLERLDIYINDNGNLNREFIQIKDSLNRINMNIHSYNSAGKSQNNLMHPWMNHNNSQTKQMNWNILIQQDINRIISELDILKDNVALM